MRQKKILRTINFTHIEQTFDRAPCWTVTLSATSF